MSRNLDPELGTDFLVGSSESSGEPGLHCAGGKTEIQLTYLLRLSSTSVDVWNHGENLVFRGSRFPLCLLEPELPLCDLGQVTPKAQCPLSPVPSRLLLILSGFRPLALLLHLSILKRTQICGKILNKTNTYIEL